MPGITLHDVRFSSDHLTREMTTYLTTNKKPSLKRAPFLSSPGREDRDTMIAVKQYAKTEFHVVDRTVYASRDLLKTYQNSDEIPRDLDKKMQALSRVERDILERMRSHGAHFTCKGTELGRRVITLLREKEALRESFIHFVSEEMPGVREIPHSLKRLRTLVTNHILRCGIARLEQRAAKERMILPHFSKKPLSTADLVIRLRALNSCIAVKARGQEARDEKLLYSVNVAVLSLTVLAVVGALFYSLRDR